MGGDARVDVGFAEGLKVWERARGKLAVTDGTLVFFGDLGLRGRDRWEVAVGGGGRGRSGEGGGPGSVADVEHRSVARGDAAVGVGELCGAGGAEVDWRCAREDTALSVLGRVCWKRGAHCGWDTGMLGRRLATFRKGI